MKDYSLNKDFKDFINCLNTNNVKYLLLGGYALGFHGEPRTTNDIDFFVSNDSENIRNLEKSLIMFGTDIFKKEELYESGKVFYIGEYPNRIEILKEASGIDFDECYKRKKTFTIDEISIDVISIDDMIINKKAANRDKDIPDINKLEKIKASSIQAKREGGNP
jgi:predicted nucleotidyltransferase